MPRLDQRIGAAVLQLVPERIGKALQLLAPNVFSPFWYEPISAGAPTYTGKAVGEQSSLQCITVLACVRFISEILSAQPFSIYERVGPGQSQIADQHPLHAIIGEEPNEEQTAFEFWETIISHILTWGNAYATIDRGRRGLVTALRILRPDCIQVGRDKSTGLRVYIFSDPLTGKKSYYLDTDLLHIPGLGFDGLKGYSVIGLARQAVGVSLAIEEFTGRFFGNNAIPGSYISHPSKLSDQAKKNLLDSWNNVYQGLQGSHLMGVLEEGLTIKTVGLPLKDIVALELRNFQNEEICRLFRVPPHAVQKLDHATFSNIEHQGIEVGKYTFRPWAVRIAQRVSKSLLGPRESVRFFAQFDLTEIYKGDSNSQAQYWSTMRTAGYVTGNEGRNAAGLRPHPSPEMDKIYIQSAMVSIDEPPEPPAETPADDASESPAEDAGEQDSEETE